MASEKYIDLRHILEVIGSVSTQGEGIIKRALIAEGRSLGFTLGSVHHRTV